MTTEPAFNPALLDIPDHIKTVKLLLRASRLDDGVILNASVIETLDNLRRYPASMIWAMEEQPAEKVEECCRRSTANWIIRADFPMLLFRRDSGKHAGNCGLHPFNWDTRVFEIGWWCRKHHQWQGLITEAAAAITGLAFRHPRSARQFPGRHRPRSRGPTVRG